MTTSFVLMASGKDIHNENGRHFEWRLRSELVEALNYYMGENCEESKTGEEASELVSVIQVSSGKMEGKRS